MKFPNTTCNYLKWLNIIPLKKWYNQLVILHENQLGQK
jgi:hypothetical protein